MQQQQQQQQESTVPSSIFWLIADWIYVKYRPPHVAQAPPVANAQSYTIKQKRKREPHAWSIFAEILKIDKTKLVSPIACSPKSTPQTRTSTQKSPLGHELLNEASLFQGQNDTVVVHFNFAQGQSGGR